MLNMCCCAADAKTMRPSRMMRTPLSPRLAICHDRGKTNSNLLLTGRATAFAAHPRIPTRARQLPATHLQLAGRLHERQAHGAAAGHDGGPVRVADHLAGVRRRARLGERLGAVPARWQHAVHARGERSRVSDVAALAKSLGTSHEHSALPLFGHTLPPLSHVGSRVPSAPSQDPKMSEHDHSALLLCHLWPPSPSTLGA